MRRHPCGLTNKRSHFARVVMYDLNAGRQFVVAGRPQKVTIAPDA
jgi:hypothetical protein